MTRLRLGVHSLRIQTGKYENARASIPVEERKCLVCKENYTEDEQHFLMYCEGYDNIRKDLHSLISQTDFNFVNLTDHVKIMYQSIPSAIIPPPPRATLGHLTPVQLRE